MLLNYLHVSLAYVYTMLIRDDVHLCVYTIRIILFYLYTTKRLVRRGGYLSMSYYYPCSVIFSCNQRI